MADGSNEHISLLRAVIDGQQKAVESLHAVATRYEELQAPLTRLGRQQARIESMVENLQVRGDATVRRLEEIESQIDRGFAKVNELQNDLFSQQNQILNTMNATLDNNREVFEVEERLEKVEAKLGMR